jgi:lon-related putative ATP-dependent protease
LKVSALRWVCDPAQLPFETTQDLDPLDHVLGQDRAVDALRFGTELRRRGWNVFAVGTPGSGRHTVVGDILVERARREPVPPDWCYVHDFSVPHRPRALRLPPGRAVELRDDMSSLVDDLIVALPAALESEEHRRRRAAIAKELDERQDRAVESVRSHARERAVTVAHGPMGFVVGASAAQGGEPSETLDELPEERRAELKRAIEEVTQRLQSVLQQVPKWHKELHDRIRALDREATLAAVQYLIDIRRKRFADLGDVLGHLDRVQADIVDNAKLFLVEAARTDAGGAREDFEPPPLRRYAVNVLVSHADEGGAPVVTEDHPTVRHLVGDIEHITRLGALTTDFTLIKPGALHRANGGYLVLDARKMLVAPLAWETLKRALRAGEIGIEPMSQLLGIASTASLEPEPIPLDVKVVLVGERRLYTLLDALDPELAEHFKVTADFDDDMPRDDPGPLRFARLIARLARDKSLRPLSRCATARAVECAARWAEDQERLSTNIRKIADLVVEADCAAGSRGHDVIDVEDVQHAHDASERRLGRVRDRLLRAIRDGALRVETRGRAVGQVNALPVGSVGDFVFGHPSRVTAQVRVGRGEIVDIEREVELGGPLHSKGVLILAGFLGGRFARTRPLSLSASLVFEQTYGAVEGDSASLAEACALMSALSRVPVAQSRAVTGSIDQHGLVQPVGAINEKIEGFFDACAAKGEVAEQGVLIPSANVRHLMLRTDVVDAVRDGRFSIWPVSTVDEAVALLTGVEAGERDASGGFPDGSINAAVDGHLAEMAEVGVPATHDIR